jgi:hypothetical protein
MSFDRYAKVLLTVLTVLLAANLWVSLGQSRVHAAYESGRMHVVKWDSSGLMHDVSGGYINGQIAAMSCPSFNQCVALVR